LDVTGDPALYSKDAGLASAFWSDYPRGQPAWIFLPEGPVCGPWQAKILAKGIPVFLAEDGAPLWLEMLRLDWILFGSAHWGQPSEAHPVTLAAQ
jgi:hypothetical protein